ncbi:DUF4345 family protein [Zhongshania sp.]|uniref:DUF4345 family protein n=1 Tax=Zhongshania sp. TaxID=1971902 RepID=UPI00356644CB
MRWFLGYLAVAWLAIGGWLFIDPSALSAYAGVAAATEDGIVELRAMYGGMELAIGLAALWALWRPRWACHVLFLNGIVTAGIGAGRLFAVMLAGSASVYTLSALAFELSAAALCWVFAKRLSGEQRNG